MPGNQNQRTYSKKTRSFRSFHASMIYLIAGFDQSHGKDISPVIACTPETTNYSLQKIYYETV
jgi:hypothetical protein